jgi:hypothetical protein
LRILVANDGTIRTRRRPGCANTRLPRTARNAAARIAVIDDAIAIVVEAVAYFRRRLRILIAHDAAIVARRRACGANALLTRIARISATWIAVVDSSIAIVVETIAHFDGRLRGLYTNELPAHTLEKAVSTNAEATRRTRATAARIALVDGAIAIVVDSITRLGAASSGYAR